MWVGAKFLEVFLRDVHPTAVKIFTHVTQKIRQLECQAQVSSVRNRRWASRLQNGQHHLADHAGRAVHVIAEVIPGCVRIHAQIHGHGVQEAMEQLWVDGEGLDGMHHGLEDQVIGLASI
ncbi:unannotated protein [freshwater metagenome]|uniref:Unannotated protein n=1 Tax=freshwater metagenome TaxID=449393 RepID=A0A6J6ZFB9_9ZZZZ